MTPITEPLMKRFDLVMRHGRYNRRSLADDLKMSRQAVQNWFSPKVVTLPKIKTLKEVARLCHCSEKFLIYGEGEMTGESLSVEKTLTEVEKTLTEEVARLKKIITELQAKNAQFVANSNAIAYLIKTQDAE